MDKQILLDILECQDVKQLVNTMLPFSKPMDFISGGLMFSSWNLNLKEFELSTTQRIMVKHRVEDTFNRIASSVQRVYDGDPLSLVEVGDYNVVVSPRKNDGWNFLLLPVEVPETVTV